ncbi:MAG: O-antigen ligase family protein [Eubacteriales bacterium]|nr:O-antigen ligase family protein [Eubacteriales bacterium]
MIKRNSVKLRIKMDRNSIGDLFFVLLLSQDFLRILLGRCLGFFRLSRYSHVITSIVIFIPFLWCHVNIKTKRMKISKRVAKACLFILCIICFFVVSYICHPSYAEWYLRDTYGVWDAVFSPASGSIYTILAFTVVRNKEHIVKNFKYIAIMKFLACLYQVFTALSRGYWEAYDSKGEIIESTYNVDFGYKAAFAGLLLLLYFILEKKKIYRIFYLTGSLISTLWVVIYGSRGAIFAYGIGLIFFLGYYIRALPKVKQLLIWCVSLLGLIGISTFYETAVSGIYFLLNKSNINSRTIAMLLDGSFMNENGRDRISSMTLELIKNQGIFGSGAFGDRPLIGPHYYWGYCHNIALEFLVDFGVILGTILLVVLAVKCITYYLNCDSWEQAGIFIAIFAVNIKLFFSDTFWGFSYFWLLLSCLFFMDPKVQNSRFIRKLVYK